MRTVFAITIAILLSVAVSAGPVRMLMMHHGMHVCPVAAMSGVCPDSAQGMSTLTQHIQQMLDVDIGILAPLAGVAAAVLLAFAVASVLRPAVERPYGPGFIAETCLRAVLSSPVRSRTAWSALHIRTGDIVAPCAGPCTAP